MNVCRLQSNKVKPVLEVELRQKGQIERLQRPVADGSDDLTKSRASSSLRCLLILFFEGMFLGIADVGSVGHNLGGLNSISDTPQAIDITWFLTKDYVNGVLNEKDQEGSAHEEIKEC
ncbi:hypothetical protein IFM89_032904 [Coptis chinensis]|uniref:Uncharacterized protein n=1 Tax=Coptis chinensis TaxID=261450 RepID=A0A835ISS6_9MAGN|nr:hypothetical protein IFM89_032904 [Coptis chinensis]